MENKDKKIGMPVRIEQSQSEKEQIKKWKNEL
jgi:hypothetical protein